MKQSTLDGYQSADYTDPDWLRSRYFGDGMTLKEMGELADVSQSTLRRHMDEHNIERRDPDESLALRGTHYNGRGDEDHNRKEWLEKKHFGERLALSEMADEADVSESTIIYNMRQHGLETRPRFVTDVMRNPGAGFDTTVDGYERVRHKIDGRLLGCRIHRLVAVAKFGFSEVANGIIHHRNQIPWDNRPDNLQLMEGHAEHTAHHNYLRYHSE